MGWPWGHGVYSVDAESDSASYGRLVERCPACDRELGSGTLRVQAPPSPACIESGEGKGA